MGISHTLKPKDSSDLSGSDGDESASDAEARSVATNLFITSESSQNHPNSEFYLY